MPLTLMDAADRETLHAVLDCTDNSGYAPTQEIATHLGLEHEQRGNQSVGSRMAWLKRYGAVEKHPHKSAWAVTPIGERMARGELPEVQRRAIQEAEADSLVLLSREVSKRYRRSQITAAHLMRRELRRGMA